MNIVFLTHPHFIGSQSMPRYARFLYDGMKARGHNVQLWTPSPKFYNLPVPGGMKKWMGYIDQFVVFPSWVKKQVKKQPKDTLYVFSDHAVGPWAPLVPKSRLVIHCHDFFAQQAALGEIPEQPTGFTGGLYQKYIRNGYKQAENFISISGATRDDLHRFVDSGKVKVSEVVYNALTRDFKPLPVDECRADLSKFTGKDLSAGYLLHVGGNQWYKNRKGVVQLYDAWRKQNPEAKLPLILIGKKANKPLQDAYNNAQFKEDIMFLTDAPDDIVMKAYAGTSVFLFPSLAEGFGWPIIEAMASGSPVITTNRSPMAEIAADAAYLIDRYPTDLSKAGEWAGESAKVLQRLLSLSDTERQNVIERGLDNAKHFSADIALSKFEEIYKKVAQG